MEQETLSFTIDIDNNENELSSLASTSKLPYLVTGEFFEVLTKDDTDQKIMAQRKHCPKTISGSRTSTGNFVSHYNVSCTFLLFFSLNLNNLRKKNQY